MTVACPQSFIIREECEKAAWQNGFRRNLGEVDGWAGFASTTAHGNIWLAASSEQGLWFLAVEHRGVIAELNLPSIQMDGPGNSRFAFQNLTALYTILPRLYELGTSLPDAPLEAFTKQTSKLPQTTESERLVVQRIGQDIFRDSLLNYWQGKCPLTGITDHALLRAFHIIPWSECSDDAERLNVHNGLLLSALWDAAFDRALVSFEDDGTPLFSKKLSQKSRECLSWQGPIALTDAHRERLAHHRQRFLKSEMG